jgi:predicted DNA-binding transcriptional regulator AlpA
MNQTTPSPSLRPHSAADLLGCGLSTFWTLAKREDFPPLIKVSSRSTIVDREQLLAWRDRQPKVFEKKGDVK